MVDRHVTLPPRLHHQCRRDTKSISITRRAGLDMSQPDPPPSSPRSPRPNAPGNVPIPTSLPLPVSTFVVHPQPPRPSLGSMLFLTAFFFFMSGNNSMPEQAIMIGPDGDFVPRVTELSLVREVVEEYTGFLNGTGNWTEVRLLFQS
jgi:hypothetical protein